METKTFKTIQTGTKITAKDLEKAGYKVSDWAKELIEKTTFSKKKESLDLVVVTPAEMGLTGYQTTSEIYAKVKELGLDLCPAEAALALRMAYTDQLSGEWLIVAMEPISDSDGNPNVFHVVRYGGGSWLNARIARPGNEWHSAHRFVFVSRKSTLKTDPLNPSLNTESLTLESAIKIVKNAGYKVIQEL